MIVLVTGGRSFSDRETVAMTTIKHAPGESSIESIARVNESLNERLRAAGYTTEPSAFPSQKRVLDARGSLLVEGTANDVWSWLSGQASL